METEKNWMVVALAMVKFYESYQKSLEGFAGALEKDEEIDPVVVSEFKSLLSRKPPYTFAGLMKE
ncbi:hypothetical protein [Lactobacillus johnsonii]|uniref:hypothetical protein n=1 Tax=Lactobacillus johnsonii TaxID=33959 RepID=UPI003CFDD3D0